jgi:hypothetical protein
MAYEGMVSTARMTSRRAAPFKAEVKRFFQDRGLECRVIYRTCQAQFGDESPHNLVPTTAEPNRISVYLDFTDENISWDKIRHIYAFPDVVGHMFPLIDHPKLRKEKVDLDRMPRRYVFDSFADLQKNWRRIL